MRKLACPPSELEIQQAVTGYGKVSATAIWVATHTSERRCNVRCFLKYKKTHANSYNKINPCCIKTERGLCDSPLSLHNLQVL